MMLEALNPFAAACINAVARALELDPALFQVSLPPRPDLGDFAVGCFPAAKMLKQAPTKLAARVAEAFVADPWLAEAEATGPFVNFRAQRRALFRHLFAATLVPTSSASPASPALGETKVAEQAPSVGEDGARSNGETAELISKAGGRDKTVCIDYSSPNISKHLAYHHIRSTVIGHALARLYRAVGYRVVGINHLGDWGTTHGMLMAAYTRWGAAEPLTIADLNALYVRFRKEMTSDPALEEDGRRWFRRLENGDQEARALWQRFRDVSWREFDDVYRLLGIGFDDVRGESAYEDDMQGVLDMLAEKNLSTISEGALVVPLGDDMPPLLLRKQDGATLYATRDLAAALYRHKHYGFHRSLYVVDRGQSLHFRQLFATLARAGFAWAETCAHVPFGVVRMGGKKTGTRTGNVVLLKDVLHEAQQRSLAIVRENNPDMDDDEVEETAKAVGIGAIVFANLSTQREKDVDFAWEQVLSVNGDSGPYVQYAHARCASILRKGAERGLRPRVDIDPAALVHDSEWALARKLLELGEHVYRAVDSNEPHVVSRYLLDLCAAFSRWYTAGNHDRSLRVLVDDESVACARLSLVAASQTVLARGLDLLGIAAPEVM